jgi:hypothetical protein
VYNQVSYLFFQHNDLIEQFTEFLPDPSSPARGSSTLGGGEQALTPKREKGKEKKRIYADDDSSGGEREEAYRIERGKMRMRGKGKPKAGWNDEEEMYVDQSEDRVITRRLARVQSGYVL